jgi:hypothetical protein
VFTLSIIDQLVLSHWQAVFLLRPGGKYGAKAAELSSSASSTIDSAVEARLQRASAVVAQSQVKEDDGVYIKLIELFCLQEMVNAFTSSLWSELL